MKIISCNDNIASVNILKALKQQPNFNNIIKTNNIQIITYSGSILSPPIFDLDLHIILSTHRSKTNKPTLTVHTPGNFSSAEMGGKEKTLCVSDGIFSYLYINNLSKTYEEKKSTLDYDFEISYEVDHHAPTIDVPILFIEIGSTEKEWLDDNAAQIIAQSLLQTIEQYLSIDKSSLPPFSLCIGGGHYAPSFTKKALENKIVPFHIIPKYQLEALDEQVFFQAIKKTTEPISQIVLDWKGLGKFKQKILGFCEKTDLPILRIKKL